MEQLSSIHIGLERQTVLVLAHVSAGGAARVGQVEAVVAALVAVLDDHLLVRRHLNDGVLLTPLLDHPLQVVCVILLEQADLVRGRATPDGITDGQPLRLTVVALLVSRMLRA